MNAIHGNGHRGGEPDTHPGERTLVIGNRDSGFFSNVNHVVDNLLYRLGRDGIVAARVDWRAHAPWRQFPYGTEADGNLWPHFFEPLAFDRFPEALEHTDTYVDFGITHDSAYRMYKLDWRWRRRYHAVWQRHIRVSGEVASRIAAARRPLEPGAYCIGVHYRHPAHREGPVRADAARYYIESVRRLLPRRRPWHVVLATDTEDALEIFAREFGSRLAVQPQVTRSCAGAGQLHFDVAQPSVELGKQALIDCMLLAGCNALVHTTSNLATAVGFLNPKLKMAYCETPRQALRGIVWSLRTHLLTGTKTVP